MALLGCRTAVLNDQPLRIGKDEVGVPAGYWKVVVDPAAGTAIAFVMRNEPTPDGDLTPFMVTVATVEKRTGFKLPLPVSIDRTTQGSLWPIDSEEVKQAKAAACPNKEKAEHAGH